MLEKCIRCEPVFIPKIVVKLFDKVVILRFSRLEWLCSFVICFRILFIDRLGIHKTKIWNIKLPLYIKEL